MIKDKNIRDRFIALGIDSTQEIREYNAQLNNLGSLTKKIEFNLININKSLDEAREYRRLLDIERDFTIIEELDKKINSLSIKKVILEKKIEKIKEYIKIEKIENEKES